MKVKIGDTIYDSNSEPIMIILSDEDIQNIKNMSDKAHKYCSYPKNPHWTDNNYLNIKKFMKIYSDEK